MSQRTHAARMNRKQRERGRTPLPSVGILTLNDKGQKVFNFWVEKDKLKENGNNQPGDNTRASLGAAKEVKG